jgi:hypothetical protein
MRPLEPAPLSPRQEDILARVVETYVATGSPVRPRNVVSVGDKPVITTVPKNARGGSTGRVPMSFFHR